MEYIVANDAQLEYQVDFTRADGTVPDFTNSTAVMYFRKKDTTTVLSTLSNYADADQKAAGTCIFVFTSSDLADLDPGEYEGEVSITTGSKVETEYELHEFYVRDDVG